MTDKLLVLTTTGSQAEAEKIAHTLVDRQLAACVNIVPKIQSVYRWEGNVETAEEYLLLIKTRRGRETEICAVIRELHSYELAECIVISMEGGSPEYLQWIADSVG
jgi:periplasmic divalent cation tolerance protein